VTSPRHHVEQSVPKIFCWKATRCSSSATWCSGLRTLISLLAFGAALSPLLAALARVVAVGAVPRPWPCPGGAGAKLRPNHDASSWWHYLWDVQTATGTYHDSSGIVVFGLAFLMMFVG